MSQTAEPDLDVRHAPEHSRFEVALGDELAYLEYRRDGNRIALMHTDVPPAFEGRGVGSRLARAAMDHARQARLRVLVFCPFVRAWVQRHPEYADLVVRD